MDNAVYVTEIGNVGIGTTSPGGKLDINNGFIKFSSAGVSAPAQGATSAGSKIVLYDGNLNHEIGLEVGGMWFKTDGQFTFYDNTGPTPRVTIKADGRVGIGTVTPRCTLDLTNSGIIAYSTKYSDGRGKEEIKDLKNMLNQIKKLRPVTFKFKQSKEKRTNFGLIAQEVKDIIPELVSGSADKVYGVDYAGLSVVLLKAVQEHQTTIEQLKLEIATLKAKLK